MSTGDYTTVVIRMPPRAADRRRVEQILESLSRYQVARSNQDDVAILEIVEGLDRFDARLLDEARDMVDLYHRQVEEAERLPDGFVEIDEEADRPLAVLAFVRAGESGRVLRRGGWSWKSFRRNAWVSCEELSADFTGQPARRLARPRVIAMPGTNVAPLVPRKRGQV